MRIATALALFFAMTFAAQAACIGSGKIRTCYDNSGNTYTVNEIGNMTITNGHNSRTGSTWSQTDTTFGNTTFTNGNAANGNSWNMTTQRLGNGNSIYSGTDSSGDFFSGSCTTFGCN